MVVDVDILSGTSAGGINAACLLVTSQGIRPRPAREIWLDLGALTDLLRNRGQDHSVALVRRRTHARRVGEADPRAPDGPFPPQAVEEPAMSFHHPVRHDDPAQRGDKQVHRLLRHARSGRRPARHLHFRRERSGEGKGRKQTAGALALAARSSASFPGAFEPSFMPFDGRNLEKGGVPARPPMARFANITRPHWVADGGLLDNQPIDCCSSGSSTGPPNARFAGCCCSSCRPPGRHPTSSRSRPGDVDDPLGLVEGLRRNWLRSRHSRSRRIYVRSVPIRTAWRREPTPDCAWRSSR